MVGQECLEHGFATQNMYILDYYYTTSPRAEEEGSGRCETNYSLINLHLPHCIIHEDRKLYQETEDRALKVAREPPS